MKRILKWTIRLFILLVVLLIAAVLAINPVLRLVIQNRIRAQTGMDAQIGKVSLSLVAPTLTIQNLKIYNPPEFDGTLFLDIPEIHVEYDRDALLKKQIHITLMRFNLSELDIVKNEAGKTNIFSLGVALPAKNSAPAPKINFKQETGYDFKGIDALNVSVGTAKYIDLKNQENNRTQVIGLENCPLHYVKNADDLRNLSLLIALRGGDFFSSLLLPQKKRAPF